MLRAHPSPANSGENKLRAIRQDSSEEGYEMEAQEISEFVWPRSPEFLLSKKPAGDTALTSASECNEHRGHDVLPGVGSFP